MLSYEVSESILNKIELARGKNNKFIQSKFYSLLTDDDKLFFENLYNELGVKFTFTYFKDNIKDNKFYPVFCPVCNKIILERRKIYCSLKCSNNDAAVKSKKLNSIISHYGNDPYHNASIIDKRCKTNMDKFGVDNPFKSDDIKAKIKQTNIDKYGCEYACQDTHVKDKITNSFINKYGVKRYSQTDTWKENQTYLYANGIIDLDAKAQKTRETCQRKYGCDYPTQSELTRIKQRVNYKNKTYDQFIEVLKYKNITCENLTPDKFSDINHEFTFTCNRCGTIWQSKNPTCKIFCPNCAKYHGTSNLEKELVTFIRSVYTGTILENVRDIINPYELDVYIPEKKLAIEFNGTYWHHDELKEKDYHFKKSKMCYDKNIRLIHVFDFEWYNKQDKIKSLILSALGIYTNTYYARNCTVHNISYKEYDAFLNNYHLNGSVKSPVRLGLFYNNELISVIGFGKSRFNHNETELHRYCVKSGYRIVGGFSKLIKHSNIKNFISFIDFSKYIGNGYYAAGFTFSSFTEPNYFYVKQAQVLTRLQCQKHKLKDLLNEAYDKNKSEYLNMKCAGYYRVYDSGNIKVVFNN